MLNKKLQSELLFEHMKGAISKEDCERTVKEIRLNEIRAYMNYFQGYLFKSVNGMSEEQLDEIANAVKFFFRIEEFREGVHLGNKNNLSQAHEEALKYYSK